jgi:CO/xanthine dehydrogenase FAD-binding subunit
LKVARAFEAERLLREGGSAALGAAAEAAMEEIETVTDVDGSADYKRLLVGVLVRRALGPALADAG